MKIALSAFGVQFAAGYDADLARNEAIDRAARKIIRTEQRAAEIAARAEMLREEEAIRAASIAARVEELRRAALDPAAPPAPAMQTRTPAAVAASLQNNR